MGAGSRMASPLLPKGGIVAYEVLAKMELPGIRGEDGEYDVEPVVLDVGDTVTDATLEEHGQTEENIVELVEQEALVES